MKIPRHDLRKWEQPSLVPVLARFCCRRCRRDLTPTLRLLADLATLSHRENSSLVPVGSFWPVALIPVGPFQPMPGTEDFLGQFAVALVDLIGVGYHPDQARLIGCCGPSGTDGPNRICACGREIGTERSDCLASQAVFLDPVRVQAVEPGAWPT